MLQTPNSSSRRGNNCLDNSSNGSSEMDSFRARDLSISRNRTSMDQQYHRHKHNQKPRNLFKNMPEMPAHYYPQYISNHGRWEAPENFMIPGCGNGMPRFGGPLRGIDKEHVDFHTLPMLKQSPKPLLENEEDKISDEEYHIQLRNYPELPLLAHEKIRELGNEIIDCYTVQLCKFFNDSLIETTPSPNGFAVLAKKDRTAQRWLMVFKNERGRVVILYNKLLTSQLLVRCLNPVSVEVEAARNPCNFPHENCVFTFGNHAMASKFVHDIHESQSILWNHREMLMENSLRGQHPDCFVESQNFGYCTPRPLSARPSPGYLMISPDIYPSLTPRMKVLPPVPQLQQHRQKRSPFTVSSRTPQADSDENWRGRSGNDSTLLVESNVSALSTPSSATQSPIRKRSKGSKNDTLNSPGGDGDFVYNSLTHSMALQQNAPVTVTPHSPTSTKDESTTTECEVSSGRKFRASEVLVSSKRDVGTGAPDEEFFSLGSGEIQVIDHGEDQFDELKSYTSEGQLMFSQVLFGWNKVRRAEGCHNPSVRWWIGAAIIGPDTRKGEPSRIREFKATFSDEESANKFAELFQQGAVKGNNPEVRKKYLAQSLRV